MDNSKVVKCEICNLWISKSNISRHKRCHGPSMLCQRCITKSLTCNCQARKDGISDLGIHYYFQSYQRQLLSGLIINTMVQISPYNSTEQFLDVSSFIVEGYFEAALHYLEYDWLWIEPLRSILWNTIYRTIYENKN